MTTETYATCPGCDGFGVLTDDPQVLRCEQCGGVFTADPRMPITLTQAMPFVNFFAPMQMNAGADGQFYFDLMVAEDQIIDLTRLHGWADRKTKRVIQIG